VVLNCDTSGVIPTAVAGPDPQERKSGLMIAPNPSSDLIRLEWSAQVDNMQVRVMSMTGAVVDQLRLRNGGTLDLSGLHAGSYLIEVSDGDKKAVSRCIITP
jgi:hypothetical protein